MTSEEAKALVLRQYPDAYVVDHCGKFGVGHALHTSGGKWLSGLHSTLGAAYAETAFRLQKLDEYRAKTEQHHGADNLKTYIDDRQHMVTHTREAANELELLREFAQLTLAAIRQDRELTAAVNPEALAKLLDFVGSPIFAKLRENFKHEPITASS